MNIDRQAIIEAVKEVGRLAFFAAATAVVAWATERLGMLDPSSVFYVAGTFVLRYVDKYIHEAKAIKANGLAPF